MQFYSFTDAPSPPRNLEVVTVEKDQITLRWEAPVSDGGSPLTGYVLEKRDGSKPGSNWTGAGMAQAGREEFTVTRLFEGAEYLFRIAAENAVGTSEFVELSKAVTAKHPFCECFFSLCRKFSIAVNNI